MDNRGGTDVDSKTLFVGNDAPTASFTISPNPAIVGQTVTFNGVRVERSRRYVVKYEWDLDGNGTFETNTGTTATTSRIYANAATVNIGLRVTDDDGATGTTTRAFSVKSASYQNAVLATPGLKDYWRMEELSGPTFADSKGSSPATASGGGVAFGSPGRARRPDEHVRPLRRRHRIGAGEPRSLRVHGGDGRVLAEMGCLRGQRRTRDRVHQQLQPERRRLPRRPEQRGRNVLRRDRSRCVAEHDLLHAAEPQPMAPLRLRARHHRRRPPPRSPRMWTASPSRTAKTQSGTGPRSSRTRRSISCRAAARASSVQALSTRWRSTTAR